MSQPPTTSRRLTAGARVTGVVITVIVFVTATFAFDRSPTLGSVARNSVFAILVGFSVAWDVPTRLFMWFQARRAARRRR